MAYKDIGNPYGYLYDDTTGKMYDPRSNPYGLNGKSQGQFAANNYPGTGVPAQQNNGNPWGSDEAYYNTMLDWIKKITDPKLTNQYYNVGLENLRRAQGQAVGGAQAAAGARAASGNLLNRGNFVVNAGNQARSSYAPAYGGLEQQRALALSGLADKGFDLNALLRQAMQGEQKAKDNLKLAYDTLSQNRTLAEKQLEAMYGTDILDWLGLGAKTAGNLFSSEAFLKLLGLL